MVALIALLACVPEPAVPVEAAPCVGEALPPVPCEACDDAVAWEARVVRDGSEIVTRFTADGRVRSEHVDGRLVETAYLPGSWRIDHTLEHLADGDTAITRWLWDGELATLVKAGESDFEQRRYRADGLLVTRDGPERYTYAGPDTWQLARSAVGPTTTIWTWDCLDAVAVAGDVTTTSTWRADGSLLHEASGAWSRTLEYVDDTSWRVAREIERDGDIERVTTWTWTAITPVLTDPPVVDCAIVPPDVGPFPSDEVAWDVEARDQWFSTHLSYTPDGRVLSHASNTATDGGGSTTTYQPGSWRVAGRHLGYWSYSADTVWEWAGDTATEVYPEGSVWRYAYRPDGTLLQREAFDEAGVTHLLESWTYLGPDTWQIASHTDHLGGLGTTQWTWDCLTSTETGPNVEVRTTWRADGRPLERHEVEVGSGGGTRDTVWTYIGDTWRTDRIERTVDGRYHLEEWVWEPAP